MMPLRIEGTYFRYHDCKAEGEYKKKHGPFPIRISIYKTPYFWIWEKNYWIELRKRFESLFQKKVEIPVQKVVFPTFEIGEPKVNYSEVPVKKYAVFDRVEEKANEKYKR